MKGIWFDGIHSYDDLGLVLSKVEIPPAQPKTTFVDIPGGDGSVDLSEALGEMRFKQRDCTFTFSVLPTDDFDGKKVEVNRALAGKRMHIAMDKNPGYWWDGRVWVDSYSEDRKVRKIVVKATVEPYKYKDGETVVEVVGGGSVSLLNEGGKTVVPTIETNRQIRINRDGGPDYHLGIGKSKVLDFQLRTGAHTVNIFDNLVQIPYDGDLGKKAAGEKLVVTSFAFAKWLEDGEIVVWGTAIDNDTQLEVLVKSKVWLEHGATYRLSGCSTGGSIDTYCLYLRDEVGSIQVYDTGDAAEFTVGTSGANAYLYIWFKPPSLLIEGRTFKPTLERLNGPAGSGTTRFTWQEGDL